jgi:endonuclease/exonuclease/phosphatase (EEP) superfamily protein YafD
MRFRWAGCGVSLGVASPVVERASRGRWLALLVLAVANLALIIPVAAGFTALADVIAPLTGHLIGIGLAASLALLTRRWVPAILAAGVIATAALHVWLGLAGCCAAPMATKQAALTRVATQAPRQGLTLLALNTWHEHGDGRHLERYLATAPADVVVLSEFGPDKRSLLANLKVAYPFQVDCADRWPCSLALLSQLPLEAAGVGRIAPEGLEERASDMPSFVWAKLAGSLTVIGTHLHRPSRDPWLHARQVSALTAFVRRIDGPLVLAGDLNTSPWSNAFRKLRAATGLSPASILMPSWPAWPLALPQMALDHILVSPEFAVAAAGTGPAVGSDHLPVWAQIERRPVAPERGYSPPRKLASSLAAPRPHLGGELAADLGGEHVGAGNLRR